MGLKTRIVIMKPNHRNEIFVLKRKQLEGKKFTHNNNAYFINDSHFQITTDKPWWRLWMFARYFTTYYYAEGQANPLPVPQFEGTIVKGGIDSEELAAIFNPWFYRTIAAPVKDVWAQLHFYVSVGTLLVLLYVAWTIYNGNTVPPVGGGPANG